MSDGDCNAGTANASRNPPHHAGFCLWLTGLSGAGKSTTALALCQTLRSAGFVLTLLDGDALRRESPRRLDFSKADRDANVRRAAIAARDVVRDGGIAVCALISPYQEARAEARALVGPSRFVEVFVDTPLAVCEARDPKGLYARCRRGEVHGVTGIDDPYERPLAPDLVLETEHRSPADNVSLVISSLIDRKLIAAEAGWHPSVDSRVERLGDASTAR